MSGVIESRYTTDAVQGEAEVAAFYNRFPYPDRQEIFFKVSDPGFWLPFIQWESGRQRPIKPDMEIWVPGCGRNQALATALSFPAAQVLGTDLSESSIEACRRDAVAAGVKNLALEVASINAPGRYVRRFDLVICTGVLHHQAQPTESLRVIAESMKDDALLELMVYNVHHAELPQAFSAAVRSLAPASTFDDQKNISLRLINAVLGEAEIFGRRSLNMARFLLAMRQAAPECLPDALINPIHRSFDVWSLRDAAKAADLEILHPYTSPHESLPLWELYFEDVSLQRQYESLDDLGRWQVTNHLTVEGSPHLWFYLQSLRCGERRSTVREVLMRFFDGRKFRPALTSVATWNRSGDAGWSGPFNFPDRQVARAVLDPIPTGTTEGNDSVRRSACSLAHPYWIPK